MLSRFCAKVMRFISNLHLSHNELCTSPIVDKCLLQRKWLVIDKISTCSEKPLLIIRNLQSEKTMIRKFYLSKVSFLLKRKGFLISRNFLSNLKEFSFWKVKLFLIIDNCLLTLQIPDYQHALF